jgi:pimeloyl-ACP methyl ester carboxylesterase
MTEHASAPGSYAAVNGLQMYYEIHGTGSPLVLLHGAFSTIESDFAKLLPVLAQTRQVIAVEQQGHGHTADIDRPLSYAQMADDTAALLQQLNIARADLFGYSMGGGVALQFAIRHPNQVRKFIFAGGTTYSLDGFYPGMLEGIAGLQPEHLAGTPWQQAYARLAPHPEDWPTLIAKTKELDLTFKGWTPEEIQALKTPGLLIIGDSDIVRPEHVVEMFRLMGGGVVRDVMGLPNSQLAILPGTTHVTVMDRTDWLASMTNAFLDAAPAPPAGQ